MEHLAIVGPTATGKSALALEVARQNPDFEIVSIDSMQIYRGMDIGTAKPSPAELREVPHHMIDVADPAEDWSVVQFQTEARAAIAEIESRGKQAILVGGTGLHYHAIVDDLRFPPQDLAVRKELEERATTPEETKVLYEELRSLDPAAANKIEPNNTRRIIRALEVIQITGMPFSASGPGVATFTDAYLSVRAFGIEYETEQLAERIAARVADMRVKELTDEVKTLAANPWSRTAQQGIGYKEILEYLSGNYSEDEAYEQIAARTRKFARRQRSWFRRDPRIAWVNGSKLTVRKFLEVVN